MLGQELGKSVNETLYPIPKFADFGLSRATSAADPENEARAFRAGTKLFLPPEILYAELENTSTPLDSIPFRNPKLPLSGQDHIRGKHPVTPAINTWATACTMYSLVTLREYPPFEELMDALHGKSTIRRDGCFLSEAELYTLQGRRGDDYSRDLRDLIQVCLSLDPAVRPGSSELLRRCEDGYARTYERSIREYG